jgi:peptidoglycan/xylan/chitin deacetylase (PgdA/CDA1 family)
MSLSELVRRLTDRSLPRRAVAVTFDDGYADNLHNAKALLERYEIPATVFVVAGNVGREFWWDELDRSVPRLEALPPRLCMTIRGCSLQWERDHRFNTGSGGSISTMFSNPRLRLVKALHHLLRPLSEEERKPVMQQLRVWGGTDADPTQGPREMTVAELHRLAAGGLVQLGAHTVTHPALADLPVARQEWEIQHGKARLEELLGQPVTTFSYPHGSLSTHTPRLVQQAGFTCACSSLTDAASYTSDRFQLPRLWPRDYGGDRFSRWLRSWL